ncbi:MAG TPA: SRPBCC family protein [Candidatus Polarisedimenticolia bacterium]|nr:SRPBCC family protein [Candidatus Polarisedimenticolia bacterium]
MRILKKLLLVLVVAVVALAGIGMLLPRQVRVERSAVINAPAATIHTLASGYKLFNKWSPWYERDPQAKYTYEGPDSGVGAKMSWASENKDVGSGSQEVTESQAPDKVKVKLNFGDGGTAWSDWAIVADAAGTKVTWGCDIDMGAGPVGRWFGPMMDKWIGTDYEKGLANLKTFAESLPKDDFAGLAVEQIEAAPQTVAFVNAACAKDDKAIAETIGASYAKVGQFMAKNGLKQAAAVQTINHKYDDSGYQFDAAIPVDHAPEKEIPADSPVQVKQTYAGKALKVVHKGSYHNMESTYRQMIAYMAAHGYEGAASPWDEYVSDPGNTPEPELLTNIVWPIK